MTDIADDTEVFCKMLQSLRQVMLGQVMVPTDHLLLDSAPNLGPLISPWEINKFENC